MANPYDVVSRPDGLGTHENDLSYEGQPLSVADNVVLNRDGMIERRRGFKDFSSNLPDYHPDQLFAGSNGSDRYLHLDNGLWYYDTTSSSWLRKRGSLGAKQANPLNLVLLNGAIYYTASSAIFRLDLSTGANDCIAGLPGTTGTADGTGNVARFNVPFGIATDGTDLFVCDTQNHTIRRVAAPLTLNAAVVTTVAGTAGATGSTDATGASARFNQPSWVAYNSGNLYLCDTQNHTIRRVASPLTAGAGVVTTIAGTAGATGNTDATGAAARFSTPTGIAFDGANLFVLETGNDDIRRVAPPLTAGAGVVTTIAGLSGSPGSADGTGSAARFTNPFGIMSDGTNLYVCDTGNHTVRKVAPPLTAGAAVVTTIAGSAGATGTVDGIGTAARFNTPYGIVSDGTNFYVCDAGNACIRKIYPNIYVTTISGSPGVGISTTAGTAADGVITGPA